MLANKEIGGICVDEITNTTMKNTELRIGNIINCFGIKMVVGINTTITIQEKTSKGNYVNEKVSLQSLNLEPISLTEEWLLKFGFNTDYNKGYIGIDVNNSDFVLTEPKVMHSQQEDYAYQFNTGYLSRYKKFKYVHELQNFFYAITGEELVLSDA